MIKKLLMMSILTISMLAGCTKEEANVPVEKDTQKEEVTTEQVKKVEGVVIGFTEDKKHVFLDTPEGEFSFTLAEALEVENDDVVFLEYTGYRTGEIEVLNVEVKSNQVVEPIEIEPTNVAKEPQEKNDDEVEQPLVEVDDKEYFSEKGIYNGKADSNSAEITTELGINMYSFPNSMNEKLDAYEFEQKVTITYFKNEDGQLTLTDIE